MWNKPTTAATILAAILALGAAGHAAAWPFGDAKPAVAPAKPAGAAPAKPAADAPPTKATAEQRAQADRLDPVSRAAFWTRETNIDPKDAEAGVGLASAERAMGQLDQAADQADQVLNTHPTYLPAMLELARARITQNKGFYAIKTLKEASVLAPKDARPWMLLGVAYEQNEQPDLAVQAYQQALTLDPNNAAALSNYALFRAVHGEPQVAEAMLRKAVAQPNAGPAERQNLALVLGLQGKMGEAERLIRQDLPPDVADTNLAYLRGLSAAPTKAGDARSWSAVQASETAQMKTPTR